MATDEGPFYALPVLKSTGFPVGYEEWSKEDRVAYVNARMFDGPPGFEPEVIDDWWSE